MASHYVQALAMAMWAFATLGFFIKPCLADRMIAAAHQGIMQGTDDPKGISLMLWAYAFLGYVPSAAMVEDFKVTPLHCTSNVC